MAPILIESKPDTALGSDNISLSPDITVQEGDIIIVGVAGMLGSITTRPDVTGYVGGIISPSASNDEVLIVVAQPGGVIPTLTWECDTESNIAIEYVNYRGGFLASSTSIESDYRLTYSQPFTGNPADCYIVFVGVGFSDGPSLWVQDDDEIFGLAADVDGLTQFGKLDNAQAPGLVSGPPTTSSNIAAATAVQGTWVDTEMFFNGGTPELSLMVAVGIDSVDPDTGSEVRQGWFVGTVGWDRGGWGS